MFSKGSKKSNMYEGTRSFKHTIMTMLKTQQNTTEVQREMILLSERWTTENTSLTIQSRKHRGGVAFTEYGSDKRMLRYHTREQTVAMLQCDVCGKTCKSECHLSNHMAITERTEMLGPVHKMRMEI